MAYRKTDRQAKKLRNMQAAYMRSLANQPSPGYSVMVPEIGEVRRQIFIFDHDFGFVPYQFDLHRSRRIDTYNITDGQELLYSGYGWHRFLGELGKAFPRVMSA